MHGVVAVAAGDAQRRARGCDARAGEVAVVDGVAQADVGVAVGADVAHGGKAGFQRQARVLGAAQGARGTEIAPDGIARVFRVAGQVGVRIDQPWQQGLVAQVDDVGAGRNGQLAAGGGDALAADEHDGVVDQRPAAHVQQMRGLDGRHRGGRRIGSAGGGTGQEQGRQNRQGDGVQSNLPG